MSFFADTKLDELEMHRARAAASLLGIRLRDILREELGGTYSVSVAYDNSLPLNGYGAMTVQFGSAPENIEKLTGDVLKEVERLKAQGPTRGGRRRVQELERRDLETATQAELVLDRLAADGAHARLGSGRHHAPRASASRSCRRPVLHEMFKKYFPLDRYTVVTLKPNGQ